MKGSHQLKDLMGQKFGRLSVIERGIKTSDGKSTWVCRCDCGTTKTIRQKDMIRGKVSSCGCIKKEMVTAKNFRHGYATRDCMRPEYFVWRGIKERCTNPDCHAYPSYGGRGITMCEEWMDFKSFVRDIGPRPTSRHTCERINNSLGYCKENCRWATMLEQNNNRRSTRLITFNGKTQSVKNWCRELKFPYTTALARLGLGWTVDRTLTEPIRKINRREHLYNCPISKEPSKI